MMTRIHLFAGSVTLAGAALLASATPAYSTMALDLADLLTPRFCCGSDTNGDGDPESYCCFREGCTASPTGCTRITAE